MKKILALIAVALLSMGAQAQVAPAMVTAGPTNPHPLPSAQKRAIRAQQKEDDKVLEAERAAQKKTTKSGEGSTVVEAAKNTKNQER